ncbi:hypothetical protein RRH01S_02_05850 [Rhizobium rhizogenes NBRC 13257]|uniref:Uncharacterized protein n=1 Tax=Rhizobium rhizogenes NBRC 13257 TaxID=1220581 RepID=A0AA87U2S7_RHIRH|nr:hypothetical protein RRH01S_02_05850 [Rhizobium rhizogenes NBRC 13257]
MSSDPSVAASYRAKDAVDFYLQAIRPGLWTNNVTIRSTRMARMYEPGAWVPRVSPTPLLMVMASHDYITMTDLELAAYECGPSSRRSW